MPATQYSIHRTRLPAQSVSPGQVAGYVGSTADAFGGNDPATVLPSNIASANVATFVAAPAAQTSIAPPAGGVGTANGGWDTAANRDLAIATITAARADVAALITEVGALRGALITAGLMAPS